MSGQFHHESDPAEARDDQARLANAETAVEADRIRAVYKRYGTDWIDADHQNPGRQAMHSERNEERNEKFRTILHEQLGKPIENSNFLDLGCDFGEDLRYIESLGAKYHNLYGIDLLRDRIEKAKKIYPSYKFFLGDAALMQSIGVMFDVIIIMTVFSSILFDGMVYDIVDNLDSVLSPGGMILWYDIRYPSPSNPHVRAMTLGRIRKFFPSWRLDLEPVSLLAPVSRRLGAFSRLLYRPLASVPCLRSHYIGTIRRNASAPGPERAGA